MQYFLYILVIPFLYLNYKIVISDLKNKIIPNKYLLYLLYLIPFWWLIIYLVPVPGIEIMHNGTGTTLGLFLGQIVLTFIISFILYYFGIWAAGDAKYLLVLSLFIPYIGIVPLIGNIALITIFYLLGYFIYFYFGKLVFNKKYRQNLWGNIKQDLSETWKVHKGNKGGNTYKIITKFLLIFFIIFVSIRLSRIYLFNIFSPHLDSPNGRGILLQEIMQKYNIYLIFLGIGIFILGLYLFRLFIAKIKNYISEKYNLNLELIGNILIGILFIILISFISYELINNYNEISNLLIRIFTLYLAIYIILKILIYSYKITFGIGEYKYIDIENLKKGDIIDKQYLMKLFGIQSSLGYLHNKDNPEEIKRQKNKLLYPSPNDYFSKIDIVIDKNTSRKIKKCFKIVNDFHKKYKTPNYEENKNIKIITTFSFAPYIILGFLITFIFQNQIFKYFLNYITELIKSFY